MSGSRGLTILSIKIAPAAPDAAGNRSAYAYITFRADDGQTYGEALTGATVEEVMAKLPQWWAKHKGWVAEMCRDFRERETS